MKEEFVSYEIARKLKACGFDWECDKCYLVENGEVSFEEADEYAFEMATYGGNEMFSVPSLSLAQRWLREVKGISVEARVANFPNEYYNDMDACYFPTIISLSGCKVSLGKYWNDNLYTGAKGYFNDYESALSAGISAALKLLTDGTE